VDGVDEVPISVFHVFEAHISKDTSVIDEHVDATKGLDGSFDDQVSVLNTVVVGNSLAAG